VLVTVLCSWLALWQRNEWKAGYKYCKYGVDWNVYLSGKFLVLGVGWITLLLPKLNKRPNSVYLYEQYIDIDFSETVR
jgi:hypothetical protein